MDQRFSQAAGTEAARWINTQWMKESDFHFIRVLLLPSLFHYHATLDLQIVLIGIWSAASLQQVCVLSRPSRPQVSRKEEELQELVITQEAVEMESRARGGRGGLKVLNCKSEVRIL